MLATQNWQEKADLWLHGFSPTEHGWSLVGPADEDEAIEAALSLQRCGVEVETFIAPLGKASYYAKKAPQLTMGGDE